MILLVRHGETASNAARIVQTPETPLSPRGLQQADRIATRLKSVGVERILSSDLARALETAQRVQAACGAPIALEPLLQERNFGDVRGTPYSELKVDLFGPDFEPPGGESWEVFHQRVDRAWARVRAEASATPGNLAVITHGLVIYSLALRHLAIPGGEPPDMRLPNTALALIEPAPPFRVKLWGCIAHLDEAHDGAAV
jgi:2,3-bisphosphoglycerate-dependent phosphoglycerate mutase